MRTNLCLSLLVFLIGGNSAHDDSIATSREDSPNGSNKPTIRRNVPNLGGNAVTLGSLYDGIHDTLMSSLNLWSPEVVKENVVESQVGYSNTDFTTNEDILKRLDVMGVDAEMSLSFMGGLIQVSGGAKYLHDEDLKENTVKSTLVYKATTRSEQMPYGVPLTNAQLCSRVTSNPSAEASTPTHVVTEVVYGLNGYMVFKKHYRTNTEKKEISGNLDVVVKSIPQIQIEGSANFNLTEDENEVKRTMEFTFYGDILLNKPPSTFEDAVEVYKELPLKAKDSAVVVAYTLTPISMFCEKQETILNSITQQNIALVKKMEADFDSVEAKIKQLTKSDVATQFPTFGVVLNTFRSQYADFKTGINRELQSILPRVRGGGASQQELTDLVDRYHKSVYNRKTVEDFLSIRTKEIETIENVMDIVDTGSDEGGIVIDDGRNGDGNKCRQNYAYQFEMHLRALPQDNEAETYEQNAQSGKFEEHDKWFYNRAEVGKTGEIKRKFRQFYKNNKDEKMCFLISLDKIGQGNTPARLTFSVSGAEKVANFNPPGRVTLASQERGRPNSSPFVPHTFHLEFPPWEFTADELAALKQDVKTQPELHITYERIGEDGKPEPQRKKIVYLTPNNLREGKKTITNSRRNKLKLKKNSQFRFQFTLSTKRYRRRDPAFKGPPSRVYYIQTQPCAPPQPLRIAKVGPNTALIQWDRPSGIAKGVNIDTFVYSVKLGGVEVNRGQVTDSLEVTLEKLLPAETYEFTIKAKSSKDQVIESDDGTTSRTSIESDPVSKTFTTSPSTLKAPMIESKSTNKLVLTWRPYVKIAEGAQFEKYEVLLESSSGKSTHDSSSARIEISGLSPGEMYSARVRVVTSMGSSDYSDVLNVATEDLQANELEQLKKSLGLETIQNQLNVKINEAQKELDSKTAWTQKQIDELLVTVAAKNQKKGIYFDAYGQSNQMAGENDAVVYYHGFNAKSDPCGLDLKSGKFTAPVDGAYLLSFNGMKKQGHKYIDLHLMVEGKTVAWMGTRVEGTDSFGPVPLTALVNMKAGQKAWVEFMDFGHITGDYGDSLASHSYKMTHFIGILIAGT